MICYEELNEGYTLLNRKPRVTKQPSSILEGKLIKKDSEKGHIAQMLAVLSGMGLGLWRNPTAFAEGYREVGQITSDHVITVNADVMERVTNAFDPLISLIVGLSLPIAGVMLSAGALMIMIGQKEHGYKLLVNCGLGYVLVNMTPLFMELLKSVGDAI